MVRAKSIVVCSVAAAALIACSGGGGADTPAETVEQAASTESQVCGGDLDLPCRPGEACVVSGEDACGQERRFCKNMGGKVCGGVLELPCRTGELCVVPGDNANGHEFGNCQPPGIVCGGVLRLACPSPLRCAFSSSDQGDADALGTCRNFT